MTATSRCPEGPSVGVAPPLATTGGSRDPANPSPSTTEVTSPGQRSAVVTVAPSPRGTGGAHWGTRCRGPLAHAVLRDHRRRVDRVMAAEARGVFLVTQACARGMAQRRPGRVVLASSISAQRGGGTCSESACSASRAAITGFTRAAARGTSPQGVTVSAVAPGPVGTDITGRDLDDERHASMAADGLVGRMGTVDDVTAPRTHLRGPGSRCVTAATHDVDGGLQVS